MAIALEYEYFKPGSLAEALELKGRFGSGGVFLAGGTDLVNNLDSESVQPEAVIDLKGIGELKRLEMTDRGLFLGPLVTFSELIDSPTVKKNYPLLWESAREVASNAIRHRATVAGNICSCVPCMDSAAPLVAYRAELTIRGPRGEQTVSTSEFFLGPRRTIIGKDEMLSEIFLPTPGRHGAAFLKQKRYRGEDLAQSNLGVLALEGNEYRVVFGSVGPTPVEAKKIEQLLAGKELTDELLAKATALVREAISPIDDIRSSREYRFIMAEVMLQRGLKAAADRLRGEGSAYGTALV